MHEYTFYLNSLDTSTSIVIYGLQYIKYMKYIYKTYT
jgi:hypothetical protein